MRTWTLAQLQWKVILALIVTFAAMSGGANATNRNLPNTLASGPSLYVGPLHSAQSKSSAVPRTARLRTPFERVITPLLAQRLNQSSTSTLSKASSSLSQRDARRLNSSNPNFTLDVNFPGFKAVPFQTLTNSNSDAHLWCSVTADFNKDGYPDIATIWSDGTINVTLNPGPGGHIATSIPLPPNVSANIGTIAWVVVADINGDGYPDLVGQDVGYNQIVIWLNNGDGTFGNPTVYPVTPTSGANWSYGGAIVVGDFNGDDSLDVATLEFVPYGAGTIITLQTFLNKGDGSGTLVTPTTETDTLFNDSYDANFGEADVVSDDGTTASGIAFLLQDYGNQVPTNVGTDLVYVTSNSDGTFTTPLEPAGPIASTMISVDGSFYATNLSAESSSSRSAKRSSSKKTKSFSTSSSGQPTTDWVFVNGDGAVYDAPYTPGGGVPTSAKILAGSSNTDTSSSASPIPNEEVLNVADMNGDGLQDLLVYTYDTVYIFTNPGAATFTAPPVQLVGAVGGDQQSQPADFDGSGFNSFFWVDSTMDNIGYFQNMGGLPSGTPGQFYAAPAIGGPSTNGGGNYVAMAGNLVIQATGDVNGDGLQDVIGYDYSHIAATNGWPDIVVGINHGTSNGATDYSFATAVPASVIESMDLSFIEPFTIMTPAGVAIMLVTNAGGVYIVTANKSGTFGAPVPLNLGVPITCPVNYGDVGDVNGDGIPDIVLPYGECNSSSIPTGYFTFLGYPDGSFEPATFTPVSQASNLYLARLSNFSGAPNNLDLALVDSSGGERGNSGDQVYVMANNRDGSGTFQSNGVEAVYDGSVIYDIVTGDYNGDGKQDLTILFYNGFLLLPGNGNYTNTSGSTIQFGSSTTIDTDYAVVWGSYADFNSDGYPDLAAAAFCGCGAGGEPTNPVVQLLPNLNGAFGPILSEMDWYFEQYFSGNTSAPYTFTGNFGDSGGPDLLVTSAYNTAEFINQGVTSLALTATPNSVAHGAAVTLTATVSQKIIGNPISGSVSFSLNGTLLGAAPMSEGIASLTTSALPVGSDVVTATYSGDRTHNESTATTTVNVTAGAPTPTPTPSPTPSPGTISVSPPHQLKFGSIDAGATKIKTLTIKNTSKKGSLSVEVKTISAPFTITAGGGSYNLASGQKQQVTVQFAPTSGDVGEYAATLVITSNDLKHLSMSLKISGKCRVRK